MKTWYQTQAIKIRDIRELLNEAYCLMPEGRNKSLLEKICADLDISAYELDTLANRK